MHTTLSSYYHRPSSSSSNNNNNMFWSLTEDDISPSTSTCSSSNNTCSSTQQSKSVKQVTLYKTEYCRNWAELGHCRYGKKCRYAHGQAELRSVPRHSRYKTQICKAYHVDGTCPYGVRCTFIHDLPSADPFASYWSTLPIPSSRTESRFFGKDSCLTRTRRYSIGSNTSSNSDSTFSTSYYSEHSLATTTKPVFPQPTDLWSDL